MQHRVQDRGDVIARDLASQRLPVDLHPARPLVVGQVGGAQDRPLAVAGHERRVGLCLGAQVDAEDVVAVGRVLGADRTDHEVALDARPAGGLQQFERTVAMNGPLAPGAAAGTGAGGEHDGVRTGDHARDLDDAGVLDVADRGLGTVGAQVGGMSGLPMRPRTCSPWATSSRVRRRAVLPCPPTITTSMRSPPSFNGRVHEQPRREQRAGAPEQEVDTDEQAYRPRRRAREVCHDQDRQHERHDAVEERDAGARQPPHLARGPQLQHSRPDEPDDEQQRQRERPADGEQDHVRPDGEGQQRHQRALAGMSGAALSPGVDPMTTPE